MLLAIDTSTNWAGLALLTPDRLVGQHGWPVGQQHGSTIFTALTALLKACDVTLEAVEALAVAIGPGSFNGVRVAVTTAKTLAYVRGWPLVGCTTLDGIAQAAANRQPPAGQLLAVLEAGREELYMGWYDWKSEARRVARFGEVALTTVAELAARHDRPALIAGEVTADHQAQLRAAWGDQVAWADPLDVPDRAVGLAQLAQAAIAAGRANDVMALEPLYVRRPNITLSTRHPLPVNPEGKDQQA